MLSQGFKQKLKNYFSKNDGTAAIEFSILALPFMVLVFGILELAIVFFTTTSLQHNLTTNTRSIRVGDSTSICGEINDIKQLVCDDLNVAGCMAKLNLNITRISSNQFDSSVLTQFQAQNFNVTPADPDDDTDNGTVNFNMTEELAPGISGNEIVLVKAVYQHDLILPGQLTRLGNFGLNDRRILTVTQAIRTEPFPNVTCSTT